MWVGDWGVSYKATNNGLNARACLSAQRYPPFPRQPPVPSLTSTHTRAHAHARTHTHTHTHTHTPQALTRGPRPIEFHAPDPLRYVSDMLAWVHTSLASEREFLVSLFGDDGGAASAAGAATGAAAAGGAAAGGEAAAAGVGDGAGGDGAEPTIAKMLDLVFESISRPLKVGREWAWGGGMAWQWH